MITLDCEYWEREREHYRRLTAPKPPLLAASSIPVPLQTFIDTKIRTNEERKLR